MVKAPYKYRYFCKPEGASGWTALTGTTTATSFTHKPARAITYQYAVKVADSKGKTSTKYFTVKVSATVTLKNASTISATSIKKGSSIRSLQQRQQVAQLLISIDISASQRVLQAGQLSQAQQQQQAIHISQLVQSLTSMQLRLQTQRVRQAQSISQLR